MTLVVARALKGHIAIVADTLISMSDMPLPLSEMVLKCVCLPGKICVAFSGSPESASDAFREFCKKYPAGASKDQTSLFFRRDSEQTNNDYIIAFNEGAQIRTIKGGIEVKSASGTHWIGDQEAFEAFRERELANKTYDEGRALSAAVFIGEPESSPASSIYLAMQDVIKNPSVRSVGGFATVATRHELGFYFPPYSEVLLDWPDRDGLDPRAKDFLQGLQIVLKGTGENLGYSINQIPSKYGGLNAVAIYVLKGNLLVILHYDNNYDQKCSILRKIEPKDVSRTIDLTLGFDYGARALVLSSRGDIAIDTPPMDLGEGPEIQLFCELNTLENPR